MGCVPITIGGGGRGGFKMEFLKLISCIDVRDNSISQQIEKCMIFPVTLNLVK